VLRRRSARFRGIYPLVVTQAPPPADIKWENLECTRLNRGLRTIAVNLLTVLVLVGAFAAMTAVRGSMPALSMAASQVIMVKMNLFLSWAIARLVPYERHHSANSVGLCRLNL